MSETSVEPLKRIAYSIAQAAEATGLGYDEIRKACQNDELDFRKRGKKYLIPVESLDAWFQKLPDKNPAP